MILSTSLRFWHRQTHETYTHVRGSVCKIHFVYTCVIVQSEHVHNEENHLRFF